MRDLQKAVNECLKELDALNIPYSSSCEFVINHRAKRRWGYCKKIGNSFQIEINADLLNEKNNYKALKDTIIHELLHTCKGCMNHSEKWKKYAEMLNKKYGYNIKRTNNAKEKGVTYYHAPPVNYKIQCNVCKKIYSRSRMSKFVSDPSLFICSRCHSNDWTRLK